MGKLLIFWMICVFAKAMAQCRTDSKFVRAFKEYERSDQAPHAVQKDKMENPAWANPCNIADGPVCYATSSTKEYIPEEVTVLAKQAKDALDEAQKFKGLFACNLQSYDCYYDSFNETSDAGPWLQNFNFINEDVFPKDKNKIDQEMPTQQLSKVTDNIRKRLPTFYKTLKMVAAGLYTIKENGLDQELMKEKVLKPYFDVTFNRVRHALCVLNDILLGLGKEIPPLMDDEIPSLHADRIDTMFMIYRDTMLYLDYFRQVMNHWAAALRGGHARMSIQ